MDTILYAKNSARASEQYTGQTFDGSRPKKKLKKDLLTDFPALDVFFRDFWNARVLSKEEEQQLLRIYNLGRYLSAGQCAGNGLFESTHDLALQARDKLIFHNLRFVVYSLKNNYFKNKIKKTSIEFADLVQFGVEGLIKGVDGYKLDQDDYEAVKIVSYSGGQRGSIRQVALRGIVDEGYDIRVHERITNDINKLFTAESELWDNLGRKPTVGELSEYLGTEISMVEELYLYAKNRRLVRLSNKFPLPGGESRRYFAALVNEATGRNVDVDNEGEIFDDYSWDDLLWAGEHTLDEVQRGNEVTLQDPTAVYSAKELKQILLNTVHTLSDRERIIIELRFGLIDNEARTLDDVGRYFGLTRERIRQLEARALAKLRHPNRSGDLKDYYEHQGSTLGHSEFGHQWADHELIENEEDTDARRASVRLSIMAKQVRSKYSSHDINRAFEKIFTDELSNPDDLKVALMGVKRNYNQALTLKQIQKEIDPYYYQPLERPHAIKMSVLTEEEASNLYNNPLIASLDIEDIKVPIMHVIKQSHLGNSVHFGTGPFTRMLQTIQSTKKTELLVLAQLEPALFSGVAKRLERQLHQHIADSEQLLDQLNRVYGRYL